MYLTHFGLIHYPFERALQPDELFASSAAREAQARLNHLVELRGIGLVTGEVGSGKTTVCRQLASALHPGLHRLFYVPLSTGNVMDRRATVSAEKRKTLPSPTFESTRTMSISVCGKVQYAGSSSSVCTAAPGMSFVGGSSMRIRISSRYSADSDACRNPVSVCANSASSVGNTRSARARIKSGAPA